MALFAGDKAIMTGDELTYDYNFDPFSQKAVQECRCGSKHCRGVLGPRAKDVRKAKGETDSSSDTTAATSRIAGAKRKMAEILDGGAERWNKKARTDSKSAQPDFRVTKTLSSSSFSTSNGAISRPSVLKRLVNGPNNRARRTVSNSSASEALLAGKAEQQQQQRSKLARTETVKLRAARIRNTVVHSVRRGVGKI